MDSYKLILDYNRFIPPFQIVKVSYIEAKLGYPVKRDRWQVWDGNYQTISTHHTEEAARQSMFAMTELYELKGDLRKG